MVWRRTYTYLIGIYLTIALISALHYSTGMHAHQLHDIYRRMYYLPIILAAFVHGRNGGGIAAAVVCIAYLPHAYGHISLDPASNTEKWLEMLLYFAVGLVTGHLVSRLKGTQSKLETSIDQLRSTETQLITTAKLAAMGQLSAGLAHEIRNPLASIKGSAEILSDDFPEDHRKHRMLQILVDESVRLNNVLTRFLAFARPQKLELETFPIYPEVESVIALLQNQREGQVSQLHLLPQSESILEVQGDREQLRQVILNVVLNACQAAGDGGQVWIECQAQLELACIAIHDSGPGFSEEALENTLTPFFTTKDKGSGLGLAVTHRIIELHGGQVRVSNADDGGGLVEIEIPKRGANG